MKKENQIKINSGDAAALIEALTNSPQGPLYVQEATETLKSIQPDVAEINKAGTHVAYVEGLNYECAAMLQTAVQQHMKQDPDFKKRADGSEMDEISQTLLNDIARDGFKIVPHSEAEPHYPNHTKNGSFPTEKQDFGYKYQGIVNEEVEISNMDVTQLFSKQRATLLHNDKMDGLKREGAKIQIKNQR